MVYQKISSHPTNPPLSDDDADTKENLENTSITLMPAAREVRCSQRTSKPYRFYRFIGTGAAPACFHGFLAVMQA